MSDRIPGILETYLSKGGVGASISLSVRGSAVQTYSVGEVNREIHNPVHRDSLFQIGSCTKTFVAAGIMRIAEDGLLDLDNTIDRWFPDLENAHAITVLQLINHRSGLPEFEHDIPMKADRVWRPRELVDFAFSHHNPSRSNEGAVYNNTGYVLAGLIIEMVSEMSLGAYVRRFLLEPCGLANTWSAATEPFPMERLARGYYLRPHSTIVEGHIAIGAEMWRMEGILPLSDELQDSTGIFPFSAGYGCGDMVSTTEDMVAFIGALFDLRVLKPQSLSAMKNDRVTVSFPGTRMQETGAGLFASSYAGRVMFGHQGSIPGYVSVMQHDPGSGITIAMASNVGSGNRMSFHASGLHSVIDDVITALAEP